MQNNKVLWVALVVVAVIAIIGATRTQVKVLGADPGPVKTEAQELLGGLSQGFVNSTSSALASLTLVGTDLASKNAFYDTIVFTKTGAIATTTWTLPASSTLASVLPKAGMRTRQCYYVATSTQSDSGLTLAAGTGWNLQTASTTESFSIEAGAMGCLDIVRQPATTGTFDFSAGLNIYRQVGE